MKTTRLIGILLLSGAIALFIPYNLLIVIFNYPDVLRFDTATILTRFYEGGPALVWLWLAFALSGLPLLPAYILIGRQLLPKSRASQVVTIIGIIGLVAQMVGLLRWVFVIPVLANSFHTAPDESVRAATIVTFQMIHQFGGVLLGEHVGQLFTVAWTIMTSWALHRHYTLPRWLTWFGYITSAIYLVAQAELMHTVIPSIAYWEPAGFVGSTGWLMWLVFLGVWLVRLNENPLTDN